jgi:phenylacetate-CoA ligase
MPESGGEYYDRLEVRDPERRHVELFTALPGLVRHALENAPAIGQALGEIDPDRVNSPAALARLPVIRKSELIALQRRDPPFGGLTATRLERLTKIFASPGPIYDPESGRPDFWRFARAMFAAGFRPGDLVHNAYAYHLTPAGSMVEGAARALGCPVIPAGTGQTELQLRVMRDLRPVAFAGTPSFLRTLLTRAARDGTDVSSLRKAAVSGEPLTPELCDELRKRYGVEAFQGYATADLGLIAYETRAREGLVLDEAVLLEIVRPGTGDPLPAGEVGEVVITSFNPDYPLIRFATGDLSAILPGPSPCGRTNLRIRGWLGRADQTTKVRGQFVHPSQVADIVRQHPEIGRARLMVERDGEGDQMRLCCEVGTTAEGLDVAIHATIREVTGLRGEVEIVAPDSLPNDGKVIEDRRPVE